MDEQLLNELYGAASSDQTSSIQDAQAELVEAVANEAGIDLDTLSDDELDKFASYVLSEDDDAANIDPSLAEADHMGRVMAHAYVNEQEKIASAHEGDMMIDYALEKQAELWEMQKLAADNSFRELADDSRAGMGALRYRAGQLTGYDRLKSGIGIERQLRRELSTMGAAGTSAMKGSRKAFEKLTPEAQRKIFKELSTARRFGASPDQLAAIAKRMGGEAGGRLYQAYGRRQMLIGGGRAAATAGVLGAAGYGGYRMMKKKSSYDPNVAWIEDLDGYEFAELAEQRAAEILLANGVDPQTFEDVYPEHVKIASFPEPEDAYSDEAAFEIDEYNAVLDDAALDILEDLGLL